MALYKRGYSPMLMGVSLSTLLNFGPAAVAVIGFPLLFSTPGEKEDPIPVAIIILDDSIGFMAPDPERNVLPGDTAAETGEEMAEHEDAPEENLSEPTSAAVDTEDAPATAPEDALDEPDAPSESESSDAPSPDAPPDSEEPSPVVPDDPVPVEMASPEPLLEVAGDLEGRDAESQNETPSVETSDTQNGGDRAAPPDQPGEGILPTPKSLEEISDYLSRDLARIREDIENGEVPPETLANQLLADAEQGNSESQFMLAALYELGLGVPEDPAKAVEWYRTAAKKRFVDAAVRLGDMLATGEDAASAPVEAQSWWSLAAKTGEPLAVAGAALLSDALSPSDNAAARTQALRVEKMWKSLQRWAAADSGGALDEQLLAAARVGDSEAIKRLIDEGANPSATDARGRSALLLSVMAGHDDAARALLRRGARVDTADADGKTALMWASDAGHLDVAELLLKRGADIAARNKYGQTALIDAAWRGREEVVKMLLTINADANARSTDGVTALMWTAINGYPETARQLIAAGAAVDALDKDQFTPLIRAAWNGHTEVVALLIEAGAKVNAKSRDGKTALRMSHSGGLKDIVALLRAAGATR